MKPLFTRSIIALIALTAVGAARAQAPSTEVEQLKAAMQTMQKNMEEMQRKLAELEKAQAAPAVLTAPTPPTTSAAAMAATTAAGITFNTPAKPVVATASPVTDRDAMNNQQEAAPRLDDLVLDPQYRGFFPIPNTDILVKLNAKPRVDMMQDN